MCIIEGEVTFLKDNDQVWKESIKNLREGMFDADHIAGSGTGPSKDGSGRSSRLGGSSAIAGYQNSIIIGTGSGKVKVISDIHTIADFLEITFSQGVKGFGLHKKDEERNSNADMGSSRLAHK